jgi:hypothetical protein
MQELREKEELQMALRFELGNYVSGCRIYWDRKHRKNYLKQYSHEFKYEYVALKMTEKHPG